jgi:hypothetical protein
MNERVQWLQVVPQGTLSSMGRSVMDGGSERRLRSSSNRTMDWWYVMLHRSIKRLAEHEEHVITPNIRTAMVNRYQCHLVFRQS